MICFIFVWIACLCIFGYVDGSFGSRFYKCMVSYLCLILICFILEKYTHLTLVTMIIWSTAAYIAVIIAVKLIFDSFAKHNAKHEVDMNKRRVVDKQDEMYVNLYDEVDGVLSNSAVNCLLSSNIGADEFNKFLIEMKNDSTNMIVKLSRNYKAVSLIE